MKAISFMNVKGGVGKTTSSISFAYILAADYNKKILLVDLDKQANTTKSFNLLDNERPSVSDLLTDKAADIDNIIRSTEYENIDLLPANMTLIKANQEVLLDMSRPQQTRLKKHIEKVKDRYDYVIFDCPTDINMAVINAFCVTDDVLIPIKIDRYALDGLEYVVEVIGELQEFNPKLTLKGGFITMFKNNNVNKSGKELLNNNLGFNFFQTAIRCTVKADESTFEKPLPLYAPKSTAAIDYRNLVAEYLEK